MINRFSRSDQSHVTALAWKHALHPYTLTTICHCNVLNTGAWSILFLRSAQTTPQVLARKYMYRVSVETTFGTDQMVLMSSLIWTVLIISSRLEIPKNTHVYTSC